MSREERNRISASDARKEDFHKFGVGFVEKLSAKGPFFKSRIGIYVK